MSKTLSAATAKKNFSESLRIAESGEVVEITRYGKPVAALVGLERLQQLQRLEAAEPETGLGALSGKFPDGDEFCEAVDQVVAERTAPRALPKLGA
ncbi:MAG: type II toxin-antitoxin system prevent-host-death family antitoxin [Acidobacteria bacterium]|nr:type II toxin-antitoxin system prevent-host-death family antitoxin [Acidobacteriota bacterium]